MGSSRSRNDRVSARQDLCAVIQATDHTGMHQQDPAPADAVRGRVCSGSKKDPVMQPAMMTPREYEQCVQQHSDALFRYALRLTRDRDQAADVVQESFMRLWMKLHAVDASKAKSYLFATAHNFVISSVRRSSRVVRMEPRHTTVRSYQQHEPFLGEHIERGLSRLPQAQRSAIVLRDQGGYSYEEIAEITGMSMDQVKVYIHRGRKAMQRFLGPKMLVA
jgi:RNA polymerase sigma factor (sigma-70 family)